MQKTSASDNEIEHVSDTALWVCHYRAKESERSDALFRDPYAKQLAGERGRKIAESMGPRGRYSEWTVVTRTLIIDRYIQQLLPEGLDVVLNLGAGLDTRPYRLNLPSTLQWIEVDYPHVIAYKSEVLKAEKPGCELKRVAVDLSDDEARRRLLADVADQGKNILVLTEGVLPYLTEDQVATLGRDLAAHPSFKHWVTEYWHPTVYPYLQKRRINKQLKNTPFQFFPPDWLAFFEKIGWRTKHIGYCGEESLRHGRGLPLPWWARVLNIFSGKIAERTKQMTGYMLFSRAGS